LCEAAFSVFYVRNDDESRSEMRRRGVRPSSEKRDVKRIYNFMETARKKERKRIFKNPELLSLSLIQSDEGLSNEAPKKVLNARRKPLIYA